MWLSIGFILMLMALAVGIAGVLGLVTHGVKLLVIYCLEKVARE